EKTESDELNANHWRRLQELERENARLKALVCCPWCGSREQYADARGTCTQCKLPWEYKHFVPGMHRLPHEPGAATPPEMRYSPVLARASITKEGWVAEMEQDPQGMWTTATLKSLPSKEG